MPFTGSACQSITDETKIFELNNLKLDVPLHRTFFILMKKFWYMTKSIVIISLRVRRIVNKYQCVFQYSSTIEMNIEFAV